MWEPPRTPKQNPQSFANAKLSGGCGGVTPCLEATRFFCEKKGEKHISTIYQTAKLAWRYRRELYGAATGVATAVGNTIADIISDFRPDKMDPDRREKTLGRRLGRHLGGSVIGPSDDGAIISSQGKKLRSVRWKRRKQYYNNTRKCCCG